MLLAALLIIAGFIFGRLWFGFILLPLIYGIPRTLYHVVGGTLRPKALVVYVTPIVIWTVIFSVFGVIVAFAGFRDFLYNSRDFFVGQCFGVVAGTLQAIGKRGRQDLTQDFWEAVGKYRRTPMVGQR